jgi:FK506-binding protein 4/5
MAPGPGINAAAAEAAAAPHVAAGGAPGGEDDDDGTDFVEDGDVTPARDGGVMKEVLVKGAGWQRAEAGDEVSMMYKGSLLDGTVFDSSYDRGSPFSFKLGAASVIKGWEVVAKTMAKGEKARVTLAPEYAYGAKGSPPKIPPDATLVFEMELIDFHSKKDVFGDGSVIKTELEAGSGWERPTRLSKVHLTIVAHAFSTLASSGPASAGHEQQQACVGENGTLVTDGKRSFMLGAGQMPESWEKVVPDMKKGAKVHLTCTDPRMLGTGLEDLAPLPRDTVRVDHTLVLDGWNKVEIISGADSSIIKEILAEGDGWERPNEGSSVVIDAAYAKAPAAATRLTSKTDADATVVAAATALGDKLSVFHEQKGFKFTLCDGAVVDGLDQAIQTMKAKERARITIAPAMAYETAPKLLPADASTSVTHGDPIAVDIELVSFEKAKDMWSMSFEEKAEEMMLRKLKGNDMYKENRIHPAIKAYERAVSLFDSPTSELSPELKKRVNHLLVQCNVNLAVCYERKRDMAKVLTHCKKALELEPSNVKALYRRGSAYMELEDYYNAESDLKYALHLSPDNVDVKRKSKRLAELRAKQDAKDKKLFSNLFGRLSAMEEKERRKNPSAFASEGRGKGDELREGDEEDADDEDDDDEDLDAGDEGEEGGAGAEDERLGAGRTGQGGDVEMETDGKK